MGKQMSLLCGTNLTSNPTADITWIDPFGNEVVNNSLYTLINNNRSVRLNKSRVEDQDMGMWMCVIRVTGTNVTLNNGMIQRSLLIGIRTIAIHLSIVGK